METVAKRLLIVAALAALLHAAPAAGQEYPPGDDGDGDEAVTVDDATLRRGEEFTITATGFAPGALVTATFFSTPVVIGTSTADASGAVIITASVPEDAAFGSHTILVSGEDADGGLLELTATVEVVGAAGAGVGAGVDLPRTGTTTLPLTGVAAVLLSVGGAFFLTARRSRAKAVSSTDD
jgi:LPXTG-motif cell wall-anchored protein